MKILVFSDTHGRINSTINTIEEHENVDLIIHLGDLVRDAQDIEAIVDIPIEYVAGNNDFYSNAPYQKIISLKNKRFLITHGHKEHVKYGLGTLIKEGEENHVDAVLFGHTHIPHQEIINNILYFNPGSMTHFHDYPSYGLVEIINDKMNYMICQKNNS